MKAHEAVMKWVTDSLAEGRLSVGDRLPGERALAETLGVSRSSLREALRVLEALGAIRTSTGSGPNAGTILTAIPEQSLTLGLSLQLATSHVTHEDVFQARLLLETWVAHHVTAERVGAGETATILDAMDDPALEVENFLALDAQFHASLAVAAGNPLISTLMGALRTSIAEQTRERAGRVADWSVTSMRLRAEHRAIHQALLSGDSPGAAELLRAHIQRYYDETS